MWHVNVPNDLKVAVTRFPRGDADLLFAALREMRTNPLRGEVYTVGVESYYRVVREYLIFFDVVLSERMVKESSGRTRSPSARRESPPSDRAGLERRTGVRCP